MTVLKLVSAAALLSAVIAAPAIAQQASQEPGAAAFYQSLRDGPGVGGPANAYAFVGQPDQRATAPVRHHVRGAKYHTNARQQ